MTVQQTSWTARVFSFPNPVNDYAARLVAGMVVLMGLAVLLVDAVWLLPFLAAGFLARVLAGPRLSAAGLLATRVLIPALGNPYRPVAGPPKRFAQFVGLLFSGAALALHWGLQLAGASKVLIAVLVLFAALEAALGFCAGCFVFGYFSRWGRVPATICAECEDFPRRVQ